MNDFHPIEEKIRIKLYTKCYKGQQLRERERESRLSRRPLDAFLGARAGKKKGDLIEPKMVLRHPKPHVPQFRPRLSPLLPSPSFLPLFLSPLPPPLSSVRPTFPNPIPDTYPSSPYPRPERLATSHNARNALLHRRIVRPPTGPSIDCLRTRCPCRHVPS